MASERPPLDRLTANDTGAAVLVVVYTLALLSVVVSIIHFWNAIARKTKLGFDDAAYILANLWAIASSITWHLAVNAGLGRCMATLSPGSINKFFKLSYTAQLIEIVAMLCTKAAFALLLDRVAPMDRWAKIITFSAVAWAVFSLFALAFQCPLPRPWVFEPAKCPTHGKLLYSIVSLNALTDVALSLWIVPTAWHLRIDRAGRSLVIILFGLKTIILVPIVTELCMMHSFLSNPDQTRVTVDRAIINQITVYISLFTSALPRTNQFLSQLHTSRSALVLPDFEFVGAGQAAAPRPDAAFRSVPPNGAVSTKAVYSSKCTKLVFNSETNDEESARNGGGSARNDEESARNDEESARNHEDSARHDSVKRVYKALS